MVATTLLGVLKMSEVWLTSVLAQEAMAYLIGARHALRGDRGWMVKHIFGDAIHYSLHIQTRGDEDPARCIPSSFDWPLNPSR